MHVRNH